MTQDAGVHFSTQKTSGLPLDLLQKSTQRLGLAALLYAGCYLTAFLAGILSGAYLSFGPLRPIQFIVAGSALTISVGVFLLSRSRRISPRTLCDLGLVYEVVGALGIDFHLTFISIPPDFVPMGISWVGVWIVCFVMIVPSTAGKTLLAALASASVTPFLLLVGVARGSADPSAAAWMAWTVPNFLCVILALAGSRVLYNLGREVHTARQMGNYRLVERLGHGGMGEVWKARHSRLARPAAIKLIRPFAGDGFSSGQNDALFRRFEREAQATARLHSKHTITLYDFGISDDGSFYYVMELLSGLDLDQMVTRFGPLPSGRAIHLLKQVCHSLGEAHGKGLIHRDVKPANIYACRLGPDYDFVKVLDFGLVKSYAGSSKDTTKLTAAGITTGTPSFMPPEVALGKPDIDARADIYALGCTAYWLVTGRLVFECDSTLETVMAHLQQAPVPPSQKTELALPAGLDELVLSCLEKERENRPADTGELAQELDRLGREEVWTLSEARSWWQAHLPKFGSD